MIFILSAPVHSGKTTWLSQVVTELKKHNRLCKGILSYAVFDDDKRIGYDIENIETGKRQPFIRRVGYDVGFDDVDVYLGEYHFRSVVIEEVNRMLKEAVNADVVIIDEIGPLELQGRGFFPAISFFMSHQPLCLVMVVRDTIVSDVISRFGIDEYQLVAPGQEGVLKRIFGATRGLQYDITKEIAFFRETFECR